jgi:hypothetical protein
MTKLYNLKFLKDIIAHWKQVKDAKNKKRRDIYHIRESL